MWEELTAFQRDLVRTLADEESLIGLQVKDKLAEEYDKDINHGRLYPNLNKLVDKGLIHKGTVDDRTNKYYLTAEGEELVSMLHEKWQMADE